MRTILFLLVSTSLASGAMLPLAWDAHPESETLDGFAVWVTPVGGQPEWRVSASATATRINLTGLAPGEYSIYLTAFRDSLHSDPSNVLAVTIPAEEIEPPENLRPQSLEVQASADLSQWETFALVGLPERHERAFYRLEFSTP